MDPTTLVHFAVDRASPHLVERARLRKADRAPAGGLYATYRSERYSAIDVRQRHGRGPHSPSGVLGHSWPWRRVKCPHFAVVEPATAGSPADPTIKSDRRRRPRPACTHPRGIRLWCRICKKQIGGDIGGGSPVVYVGTGPRAVPPRTQRNTIRASIASMSSARRPPMSGFRFCQRVLVVHIVAFTRPRCYLREPVNPMSAGAQRGESQR
jgi:hypothetical protein